MPDRRRARRAGQRRALSAPVSNEIGSDGLAAAQLAGLGYTNDEQPGIGRRRAGRGFVRDRRLARVVARLEQLPGQELFRYRDDDGELRPINSEDVNAYLREISGDDLTAKDFRTWAGTVLAARALAELGPARNERIARERILQAIDVVSARLGNTRAVCRECYLHPGVLEAYAAGDRPPALRHPERMRKGHGLSSHEAAAAAMLTRAARRAGRRAVAYWRYAAKAGKSSEGGRAARARRSWQSSTSSAVIGSTSTGVAPKSRIAIPS